MLKARGSLTRNFALTRQCNDVFTSVLIKKVAEWLCSWLETRIWGFNSFLSRLLLVLERMRALRMCGMGEGIRGVILRLWLLARLRALLA